ncbi:MAG: hypothetical protein ACI30S_08130 [Muribaculaceae bacterium]
MTKITYFYDNSNPNRRRNWLIGIAVAVIALTIVAIIFIQQRYEERHLAEIALMDSIINANRENNLAEQRRADSIAAIVDTTDNTADEPLTTQDKINRGYIPNPESYPEPSFDFCLVEEMVCALTNENYYASVWNKNSFDWIVIYTLGGKNYIRTFYPEKYKYGTPRRIMQYKLGVFRLVSNPNEYFSFVEDNYRNLYHFKDGKVIEIYYNHNIIELNTPNGSYEDGEDYYYDNEEDDRLFYGR